MSAAAAVSVSSSTPNSLAQFRLTGNKILVRAVPTFSRSSTPLTELFLRNSCGNKRYSISTTRIRRFSPVMEWQDCMAKMEIDVPCSVAYNCYSDRETIPRWMPFISSVKILEDKPDLSRWSLKYKAFGRDIEFSWLAQNFQPIPNQKIHWRSLEGLPNRGAVRFYPKGPSSCLIELTVSYEVPPILIPVASALKPFLEQLLLRGLERGLSPYWFFYSRSSEARDRFHCILCIQCVVFHHPVLQPR
ncbi:hypothetical protein NE237_014513 [Protea cynaroides]|uniref:Coenzyme Q-binding protein COQ10 START domain-containing protein n=1 Tax=Protea cynaroides TaxID=273540 RepID=A0A9Q0QQ60_9MAGN|nr:hypothetical protein NE237_014513 [Protea cynaroides]